MTVIPIARYLVKFDEVVEPLATGQLQDDAPALRSFGPGEDEDLARQLEAARESGREEARAAANAELEFNLAREQHRLEARIAQERETWLAQESETLSRALDEAFSRLESSIAGSVARILKPFVTDALREQAVASLSETLSGLLSDERALVRVSGPENLLNALRDKIGTRGASIEFHPGEPDVRIIADHTVIESRLRSWIERFDPTAD